MSLDPESPLAKPMATLPRAGGVEWIGVRPARDRLMWPLDVVQACVGGPLRLGDRVEAL
ncbi:MAG: hypothetical protein QM581_01635 [Pseudomonas sp.]